MGFLHSETTAVLRVLSLVGDVSSYAEGASFVWHLKPISLDDTTFDTTGIAGESFKFTMKGEEVFPVGWELTISGKKYIIRASKIYKGLLFNTTKVLLNYIPEWA